MLEEVGGGGEGGRKRFKYFSLIYSFWFRRKESSYDINILVCLVLMLLCDRTQIPESTGTFYGESCALMTVANFCFEGTLNKFA